MRKIFGSLQAKYMLLIITALAIVQFAYLLSAMLMTGIQNQMNITDSTKADYVEIEHSWHNDITGLTETDSEAMHRLFEKWSIAYPESSMFWVDEKGNLASSWQVSWDVPTYWTSSYTVSFMKERYGSDPFTVVALVGDTDTRGFAVIEIARSAFDPPLVKIYDRYGQWLIIGVVLIIILFIIISYMFFRSIRKRLLHLQKAMNNRNGDGLPVPIAISRSDEIGQLENAFNHMVTELNESKLREQEEERIRQELIANLSHDLRTPLTKIQSNAYSLTKLNLPDESEKAVHSLQKSVEQIDTLIENLMSYTLLMSHKYRLEMKDVQMIRFLREHLATWYATFEKADFEIDVSLDGMQEFIWKADPIWLGRIMDNLFQNVLRHASSGRYIGLKVESEHDYDAIIIVDHGGGMDNPSNESGAGIGLSIVDMMVNGMNLSWDMRSDEHGLTVEIRKTHR
ncbi:HAMP domain-containing sensor histidine kinase [Paenibacillus endoradicis]|uniref:HAMP domain-containing sensor histidine kinase n=1 Tax=Paenibacillus endoradicis TaxID=2972487 RepID=UPI002158E8BC|nr:HAMP domain-containing sensor histidine kinase [Paenibacillus endoradicis]MCR8657682.1 HAMP domain-containing histidine kinase [Paenibacillus endoradicis]